MVQIKPQIVLGFGGFDLDEPESLARDYSAEELQQLEEAVKEETFWCSGGHGFRLTTQEEQDEKLRIARRLSSLTTEDSP